MENIPKKQKVQTEEIIEMWMVLNAWQLNYMNMDKL